MVRLCNGFYFRCSFAFFKIFGRGMVKNRPFLQKNHYFCQFLPHFWSFCQDTVQKDANKGNFCTFPAQIWSFLPPRTKDFHKDEPIQVSFSPS